MGGLGGVAEFSITLARGNAELMQEVPVRVSGFKPVIDGTQWLAASVDHTIDGRGGVATGVKLGMRIDQISQLQKFCS